MSWQVQAEGVHNVWAEVWMAEQGRKRREVRPMQHVRRRGGYRNIAGSGGPRDPCSMQHVRRGGGKPAVGIAKICPFEYVRARISDPPDSSFHRRLPRTSALLDTYGLPIFKQHSKAREALIRVDHFTDLPCGRISTLS